MFLEVQVHATAQEGAGRRGGVVGVGVRVVGEGGDGDGGGGGGGG